MKYRECSLCTAATKRYTSFGECPAHGLFELPLVQNKVARIKSRLNPAITEEDEADPNIGKRSFPLIARRKMFKV